MIPKKIVIDPISVKSTEVLFRSKEGLSLSDGMTVVKFITFVKDKGTISLFSNNNESSLKLNRRKIIRSVVEVINDVISAYKADIVNAWGKAGELTDRKSIDSQPLADANFSEKLDSSHSNGNLSIIPF